MKVNAVALSFDNRLLASASADNTIRIWDVGNGRELRALTGHKGWVKCVSPLPTRTHPIETRTSALKFFSSENPTLRRTLKS